MQVLPSSWHRFAHCLLLNSLGLAGFLLVFFARQLSDRFTAFNEVPKNPALEVEEEDSKPPYVIPTSKPPPPQEKKNNKTDTKDKDSDKIDSPPCPSSLAEEAAKAQEHQQEKQAASSTQPQIQKLPPPMSNHMPNRGTPQHAGVNPPIPAIENLSLNDPEDEQPSTIRIPTSVGSYKLFDYTTHVMTAHILVHMLLHSAVVLEDILFEWISPSQLKFSIAWPMFFQNAEEMATFTLDNAGNMVFPPTHPLTMDTSRRNQSLVADRGCIWDESIIQFEQDMVQDNPIIELLTVNVLSNGISVKCLQIYAK